MAVICMVMRSVVGGATRPYAASCGTELCCTVQEIYCLSTGQRCAAAATPTVSTLTVCNEEPYLLPDVLVLNLNPLCYSSRYRRPVEESHIGYGSTQWHEGGRGEGSLCSMRNFVVFRNYLISRVL